MEEQINFKINNDVSIKGTNSIKDLNAEFSKVLSTVKTLKESTIEANNALKSTSSKTLLSDADVNKMLSSLDGMFKRVEAISNNTFDQLGKNIEASLSSSFEAAFKKYAELSEKAANGTLGKASGHGLLARANRANYDSISEDIYERLYGEAPRSTTRLSKLSRRESAGISRFARQYQDQIAARRLSDNISAFDTGSVDYIASSDLAKRKRYVQEVNRAYEEKLKILKQQNQYLLTESAGIKDFRTTLGQKDWKSFASDNRRHYNDVKADFYAERTLGRINAENTRRSSISSGLLLTADAGKAKAAEENATAEKKSKKAKEMTEYQKEKIRTLDEKNAISAGRAATEAREADRRSREFDENAGVRAYKNAHPELFETGGLNHNKKFQTGHMFQALGGIANQLGSGGRAAGLALDSLGAFFKAVPLGIATTIGNLAKGITELGKASVQAYAEIESIKTQLGVVFSNQTQADSMFGQISQYAVKSPFGVQQTSELAVLLKQSGVYASDLMDTLKMLGDTAGGNMEKMKRIANNYAQIVSIGKASMLDMRQFAYAGIPIFEAVSKELGVSQQELRKLISDGKVTSDIIEKVFKDLSGINGIFENATEKGAKTLKARLQNLADAKQLALGATGERIVNAGTTYGNDSLVLNFVSTAEQFFTWVREHNDIKNIERDVNTIATSDKRISELETLLKYAKDIKDKELQKIIETELANQKAMFDVDKQRAIYSESYDIKNRKYEGYKDRFGFMTESEIKSAIEKYEIARDEVVENKVGITSQMSERNLSEDELKLLSYNETQISIYDQLINDLKDYSSALKEAKTTTDEETKAHRESILIDKQQEAFDAAQKEAGKTGSYASAFDKLYSIETASEEYKKKKEEEEINFLKEAQEALKKLTKVVDKEGNLDTTKLSYKEFSSLYNDKHAFDPNKKLTIVEGKLEAQMTADREILNKQWNDMSDKIEKELSSKGQSLAVNRMGAARRMYSMEGGDNKTYFQNFDLLLNHQLSILEELVKENKGKEDEKYYQDMYNNLLASTFRIGVNTKGVNANPNDINKNVSIPLWKRILAGATGLTTQGMTDTQSTMENYRDDMAIRNMTAGVLSATFKSMGVETAMELVKTSGNAKKLKDDTGYTYQVDWGKTQESIKKFSLQLSAATEVVSAYKKGLEDELDVYEQLIVAGYTEAESQDLKNQKTVSVKKLAQLSGDAGDQLVNAFGEILTTKSGKQYKASDINIQDGRIFDKLGNEIEEEVILTGKLFEFIKSEMPKLRDKIFEATEAELNNKLLNNLFNNVAGNAYMNDYMQKAGYGNSAALMLQHPEYVQEYIDSYLTTKKNAKNSNDELIYPNLAKLSNADIYLRSLEATPEKIAQINNDKSNSKKGTDEYVALEEELKDIEDASKLVTNAFAAMGVNIGKITNGDKFATLMALIGSQDRDMAVNNALLGFTAYSKNHLLTREGNTVSAGTALKPEDYSGWRGRRNRLAKYGFGINQQYDIEDLYIKAAKTSNLPGKDKNQFGIDSTKYTKPGMSDEDILKSLTKQEKEWIKIIKLQKDSATTLNSIADNMTGMLGAFVGDAITSTFNEWGSALAKVEDTSSALTKNMLSLSASLMSNMGSMVTQAGLSLAVSSIGDKAGVIAGLAIAAAGGGMSFLGGYLNGALSGDSNKEENKELEKLLKIKQDLADLLKQAREDAIYYENTTRHKKAISANDEFTKRSVHDAVITPKGDVITTDPMDYLIATKTPKTLVGGGAPTINFSVVDKSTGIKVTRQRSTYDESTNSINFEAVIESKVQEVIASSKGDDAFAAREARLRGHSVIA